MADETNVELTPAYLGKVADKVNSDKKVVFQKTVEEIFEPLIKYFWNCGGEQ